MAEKQAQGSVFGGWGPLFLNLVLFAGAVVAAFVGLSLGGGIGLALLAVGALLFAGALLVLFVGARRARAADPGLSDPNQWWYNNKTGEVEQGMHPVSADWDGPYSSREDALRAPEIARDRARKWAEDEKR